MSRLRRYFEWLGNRSTLAANAELKNRHRGERGFILATGPSIRTQDLTPLRGEHCIAVSNFFVHPHYASIAPAYHCIAPYHLPIPEQAFRDWLAELGEKSAGHCQVFLATADRERAKSVDQLKSRTVRFLQFGGVRAGLSRGGIDLTRPVPPCQSVSIMALQVAIYLGFDEIYLLGCDHDWILQYGTSRHFYAESQHVFTRSGYNEFSYADLEVQFNACAQLWKSYKDLRGVAQANGQRIFNATDGGLLDVFPRVQLADLFHGEGGTRAGTDPPTGSTVRIDPRAGSSELGLRANSASPLGACHSSGSAGSGRGRGEQPDGDARSRCR